MIRGQIGYAKAVWRGLNGARVIAGTTLREAVRNRVLLIALAFALVLVVLSMSAAALSIWERSRLIIDVGLGAAGIVGSVAAIATTISTYANELRQRTAFSVLVRPIPRWSFVLGKYLGVLVTIEAMVTCMLLTTALTVVIFGQPVPMALWASLWVTGLEMAIVCATATLFSTLTGPVLAAIFSSAVVLAGNLSGDLTLVAASLAQKGGHGLAWMVRALYYLLPDLQGLSVRVQAANNLPVPIAHLVQGTWYTMGVVGVMLLLAMMAFTRRRSI